MPAEIAYFGSQRLGRIAAVGPSGQPHAVPVRFRSNADDDTIDTRGHGFARSKKFRDAHANPRVAFIVDDLASVSPWRPRGVQVRGIAELLAFGGEAFGRGYDSQIFRVRARRIVSWSLEGERRNIAVRP